MGFCSIPTFVVYRKERCWRDQVANPQNKISTFLKEQKHEFVDRFSDDE